MILQKSLLYADVLHYQCWKKVYFYFIFIFRRTVFMCIIINPFTVTFDKFNASFLSKSILFFLFFFFFKVLTPNF